ncbi:hypothetical protein K432DRAFT_382012 [Lepidopterella palustris CBS 459.81]|uniref:Uncharacterized protein n=1 Tax=Lepidopterella palustris CBS 459.81 TaxID=1314670 RepID=A0A8E2EBD1_9PEZI|nr:hypothetical protein K432DRAFT_382012 [Lepidopterella palustris CBS 459.81]
MDSENPSSMTQHDRVHSWLTSGHESCLPLTPPPDDNSKQQQQLSNPCVLSGNYDRYQSTYCDSYTKRVLD